VPYVIWLSAQEHSKYFPQYISIIIKRDYPWIITENIHSFHHTILDLSLFRPNWSKTVPYLQKQQ